MLARSRTDRTTRRLQHRKGPSGLEVALVAAAVTAIVVLLAFAFTTFAQNGM